MKTRRRREEENMEEEKKVGENRRRGKKNKKRKEKKSGKLKIYDKILPGIVIKFYVNCNISIISLNVLMTVFTVKTILLLCVKMHCKFVINVKCFITFFAFCFISGVVVNEDFSWLYV